ncbi:hypothetical protein CRE_25294 [Caenorhabditis remanei]|uniref:Uncharacterized protein n=1 Tax=Caenorhabditis remanei TaxID=31234 RepID=E3LSC9_CAERE|nr:hypothetical protein CRE_25294 [Caenorhabditis remanei]
MPRFYDASSYSEPPKVCCIPVKLVVLFMQIAALILPIASICFARNQESHLLFGQVLWAIYFGLSFVAFLVEHKGFMVLHCFFGIACWLGACVVIGLEYFKIRVFSDKPIFNGQFFSNSILLVGTGILLFVALFYIIMCSALVRSLGREPVLPDYNTAMQQPTCPVDTSEHTKLIYPIYPQL